MKLRMNKKSVLKLNIILACGLIFILSGFFLLMNFSKSVFEDFPLIPVMSIILGTAGLYFSLTFFKKAFVFFLGFYAFLLGVFSLYTSSKLCPVSFSQCWPISAVLCSLSLLVTSVFKNRRITSPYAYPSIAIGSLGVVFFLFSSDLVKLSFSAFMGKWWPVFLVACGIILVVLFLIQQNTNNFPYAQDDEGIGDILG